MVQPGKVILQHVSLRVTALRATGVARRTVLKERGLLTAPLRVANQVGLGAASWGKKESFIPTSA